MLKEIPDFPDYFADENGNIYSMKPQNQHSAKPIKPKLITQVIDKDGYAKVYIRHNGKGVSRFVHTLILETFIGVRPENAVARHGRLGKKYNTPDNLSWGTIKENNSIDKLRDNTMQRGEKNGLHKINSLQARIIKRCYCNGQKHKISYKYLAEIFNVSRFCIYSIRYGLSWKYI